MVETRRQKEARERLENSAAVVEEKSPNGLNYTERSNANGDKAQTSLAKEGEISKKANVRTPKRSIIGFSLLCIISYIMWPEGGLYVEPGTGAITRKHVWYYGWITAVSTGLGVVPLLFVRDVGQLDKFYIGMSNAVASGMMMSASFSLIMEGMTFADPLDHSEVSCSVRTLIGIAIGLVFIFGTKKFLDEHEDIHMDDVTGADAKKILLIIIVMTLHSFSEGVGIGVSFGGENGDKLGMFISASLAVHNIPEGLAVAVVLLPRGIAKLTAANWCIFTSLPQPLMAVPAFMFVNTFIPILPIGLGFAGGAMAWVAVTELLVEAYEDTDLITTASLTSIAAATMLYLQESLHKI